MKTGISRILKGSGKSFVFFLFILFLICTVNGAYASDIFLGDTGIPDNYLDTLKRPQLKLRSLPSSFNWADQGMVTSAKNQGACGSCWAFAATGALESKILMYGKGNYDLSEQQQVSCNASMNGCRGGSMASLLFWQNTGPLLESCTGYTASNSNCDKYAHCSELSFRTTGYYTVNTNSIEDIKASLYGDGPTYFRYDVYNDFNTFWSSAGSGAVYKNNNNTRRGGHAVLIIGWDDSKNAWLCKNSWGKSAGPNGDGTFWIAYSGHKNNLRFGMANVTITSLFSNQPTIQPEKH